MRARFDARPGYSPRSKVGPEGGQFGLTPLCGYLRRRLSARDDSRQRQRCAMFKKSRSAIETDFKGFFSCFPHTKCSESEHLYFLGMNLQKKYTMVVERGD